MTVAAAVVGRTLAELGVRQVFGVVGSGNFVVTKSSARGTPLSATACPTCRSFPYIVAVSMCRYPTSSA